MYFISSSFVTAGFFCLFFCGCLFLLCSGYCFVVVVVCLYVFLFVVVVVVVLGVHFAVVGCCFLLLFCLFICLFVLGGCCFFLLLLLFCTWFVVFLHLFLLAGRSKQVHDTTNTFSWFHIFRFWSDTH